VLTDVQPILELGKREFGISGWLEVPHHNVNRRSLRFEKIRPRIGDVKNLLNELNPEIWYGPLKDRNLEEFTESAWLSNWRENVDSDDFGPRTWPLVAPFDDYITIYLSKDRKVFFDPICGEPIPLGNLSDGKDEIIKCIENVTFPPFSDISPDQVKLSDSNSGLLHPNGFSFRCKIISSNLYGSDKISIDD
jgi:hypothetical protein